MLFMTAVAIVAAFFCGSNRTGLLERRDELLLVAAGIFGLRGVDLPAFRLYHSKWRFASLPDIANILGASTVLALTLVVIDYILVAPNFRGTFFFGKLTIIIYWLIQIFLLGGPRIAYRYFRYTRTRRAARVADATPVLVLGRAADAEVLMRAIESGAVKKIWPVGILSPSPADYGPVDPRRAVLGGFDDIEQVIAQTRARGQADRRIILTPAALEPQAHPEKILIKARRLGLATQRLPSLEEGSEALRLAAVHVEDLLLRPSVKIDYRAAGAVGRGKIDRRYRWGRLDRRRDLRSGRDVRRRPRAGDRKLGAGAARGAGGACRQSGQGRGGRAPRRRARPGANVSPDRRVQAGYRLPCRRAQKIERWHLTLKNRILLENYYLPGKLEARIEAFVAHYNHLRYHESINNLTPADVYFGRGQTILLERERIKRKTIQHRRLLHKTHAA